MATVTQSNLLAKGFVLVQNGQDRFQRWSGNVNGNTVEVIWDSVGQKAYQIPDVDAAELCRIVVTLSAIFSSLLAASSLSSTLKTEAQTAISSAIHDIAI